MIVTLRMICVDGNTIIRQKLDGFVVPEEQRLVSRGQMVTIQLAMVRILINVFFEVSEISYNFGLR